MTRAKIPCVRLLWFHCNIDVNSNCATRNIWSEYVEVVSLSYFDGLDLILFYRVHTFCTIQYNHIWMFFMYFFFFYLISILNFPFCVIEPWVQCSRLSWNPFDSLASLKSLTEGQNSSLRSLRVESTLATQSCVLRRVQPLLNSYFHWGVPSHSVHSQGKNT